LKLSKMKKKNNKVKYILISIISFTVFLIIWYMVTDVFKLVKPISLPSPVKVLESFINKFTVKRPDGSTLQAHVLSSLRIVLTGYIAGSIVGVPLGIFMAWNRKADMFIRPVFDWFRSVPGMGWIPVMILIFGINIASKAAIVFAISFVAILINSYSGIKNTNPVHMWVAQTFGASNKQLLFRVAIPSALPHIFTGLRQGLNQAWASVVAAEMIGSNRGLGYMIQMNRENSRADLIIVGMLSIGLVGTILSFVLQKFEDKYVRGRH